MRSYVVFTLGILWAIHGIVQAGTMGPTEVGNKERMYLSIFAGGGSSNQVHVSQYGTAMFIEAEGGPLAVNAFGDTNSRRVKMIGGNVGYQSRDFFLNPSRTIESVSLAGELEGYYSSKSTWTGHDISNDRSRLPEHDFLVTYPTNTSVYLINTVLNFNSSRFSIWHPYVGVGIGAAVSSITNADALQVEPLEVGFNHYNGNPNDSDTSFAAQAKAGLNLNLSDHVSIFAEYRWLYIASTNFTFGSTVYPTHAPTSPWGVQLGPQYYNMGAGGVRLII